MPQAIYDGVNLNVDIPSTGGDVITMDALEDFYEPWKDFLRQGAAPGQMENKKFPQCWRPIAGDPITATTSYTGMIFLQNQLGWRMRLPDENVTLIVTGNLTLQDTTLPFHRARAGKTGSILGLAEYSTTVATGSGLTPTEQTQLSEIFKILGLDPTDEISITPAGITTQLGSFIITFTGDGISLTKMTRT